MDGELEIDSAMKWSRVGILGSRKLACRITQWIAEQPDVEIVGVVAPPFKGWWRDRLRDTANSLGIPVLSLGELMTMHSDVVFSLNYWRLLPLDFTEAIPGGVVNVHHSYNLRLRGRYSTSWAIVRARQDNFWKHGTTLHYIDEDLDRGRIIESRACDIEDDDTAETLFAEVENLAFQLFRDRFRDIMNGACETYEPPEPTFFYGADSNANLEMSWDQPPEDIYDFVRAWTFPGRSTPYFVFGGKKLFVSLGQPMQKENE